MASTYLSYTQGTPTNNKKWTWSAWIKLGDTLIGTRYMMSAYADANNATNIRFLDTTGRLDFQNYVSSSDAGRLKTSRYLRDPTAWYHIVCVFDSDNVTSGDRQQIWINGVRETAFDTETYPSSGAASIMNVNTRVAEIGRRSDGTDMWNGSMAHVHFCDGQAYTASSFGETDATSGIWIPKSGPSVTYGDNGYFMKFASGATGTDSSGESNNMTVTGNLTSLKDNPENNFCTLNPLDTNAVSGNQLVYSECNNTVVPTGNNWKSTMSTMAVTTGKYYFETKIIGSSANWWVGIVDPSQIQYASGDNKYHSRTRGYAFNSNCDKGNSGSEVAYGATAIAQNDIICVAVDITNSKIYTRKNGDAWVASGNPTSGATGTGSAYTLTQNNGQNIQYMPFVSCYSTSAKLSCNFGAGYFGTTAVASAGTNASGVGTFEFDVPAGYTAFSTKGLDI